MKYLDLTGLREVWANIKSYISSKIPTKMSQLQNDSNYATTSQLPRKTSQLTNDSDFTTNAKLATKQDTISDLASIRSGASKGATAVQPATLKSYAKTSAIPTKTSQLTNDSGFLTSTDISNKADKATTLSGYGITDTYTKTQVDKKVADLVSSAPETLDTLNELASALGNDPNFATTVANQIGTKANNSDLNNYLRLTGGTITNSIDKVGVSCSWKDGRTYAIVKTNATSSPSAKQYVPCISAKSYQGSWELGTYTNNDYYLTYVTDADFDAGTNKAATQYKFRSDGTLIATKFQGALVGNADTATKATNNASGNELSNSIIKGLSVKGKVITYTKLDGSTGTITTQDTNTDTKVTNTLGNTTKAYITGTTSATTNTGTQIFDSGVYLTTTAGQLHADIDFPITEAQVNEILGIS